MRLPSTSINPSHLSSEGMKWRRHIGEGNNTELEMPGHRLVTGITILHQVYGLC